MSTFVTGGQGSEESLVPDTHELIDHTASPLDLLNAAAHAGINHAGLPGVGDVTVASHAAINHTGLPGVGDVTVVSHSAIDHTGIPGVGGAGITVLETTSTAAQINTALSTYQIVYLKPGNYGALSTTITIPDDKALIALSAGPQDGGSYGALFQPSITSSIITMGRGSRLEGVSIIASGAGAVDLINIAGGPGWSIVRNCFIKATSWTGRIIDASNSQPLLENIGIYCTKSGSVPVIDYSHSTGSNEARCAAEMRNIRIELSGGAGTRIGIEVSDGTIFENCYVTGPGSHGFSIGGQFRNTSMFGCVATGCGGNGFNHAGGGTWIIVSGCLSRSNTGIGFNFPSGGGTVTGFLLGNRSDTNGGGNYTIGAAICNVGNL
jgi:hypothetical protein